MFINQSHMYQLVYSSIASPDITSKDINDILLKAREFNFNNDITGCLLYHNYQFAQILEGDQATIKKLYNVVEKDTRHSKSIICSESNYDTRVFKSWDMAFCELKDCDIKAISEELFKNNFLTLGSLSLQPTSSVRDFWKLAAGILHKKAA